MTRSCNDCGEDAAIDMYLLPLDQNFHFITSACPEHAFAHHRKKRNKPRTGFYTHDAMAQEQVMRELLKSA